MGHFANRQARFGCTPRWQRGLRAGLTLVLVIFAASASALTDAELAEYRIKAAFLYKFGSYIEWPQHSYAGTDSPFAIGIYGADEMADELAGIVENHLVDGRKVEVRKLTGLAPVVGLQVVFIGRSRDSSRAAMLTAYQNQPVLTVTETSDADLPGTVINFVVADDKVKFDVVLPNATARSLRISARLLAVARHVRDRST